MAKAKSKTKKLTVLQKQVQQGTCAEMLTSSKVLAIDPSIGSASSSMGYAWYEEGQLKDAGILEFPPSMSKNKKLQEIRAAIMEEFDQFDVLVIENIAPMRVNQNSKESHNKKTAGISAAITKGWKNLHQATGAAIAASNCEYVVEVAPITWRKYIDESYQKNDAADATLIGYAAIKEACDYLGKSLPRKYFVEDLK